LLSRLLARAEKSGRLNSVIEILALQSTIYHLNGEIPKAMLTIERSLALAEPEGYVRLFVDEGLPMAQVLRHASSRRILPGYVAALLAEFGEHPRTDAGAARMLVEPLSPREIEVLHLLSAGLSNREIGEALFISPGTVNTHTRRIYQKLEVGNRTQAVARARELKLL
jgi:LuxR family maltose regulon positive regulatory protein